MARRTDTRRELDDALASLLGLAGTAEPRRKRRWWARGLRWIAALLFFAVLPFLILLRGGTWLYGATAQPAWICVVVAGVAAGFAIFLATAWLVHRIGVSLPRYGFRLSLVLAAAYCIFALVYVSADNVKQSEIRETYTALHPLLRLSVSTLVLFDSDQVITDSDRSPEDYQRMGLSENPSSLHYRQADGYVHAVDLRTVGRPPVAVLMTTLYFRATGFRVLRHTGTADHLHVSLPVRRPR